MPSIFMRFWYTSFHLLQYLLYQEIGGGRMTDQTDIASLAFQWQPPFLLFSHSASSFFPASSSSPSTSYRVIEIWTALAQCLTHFDMTVPSVFVCFFLSLVKPPSAHDLNFIHEVVRFMSPDQNACLSFSEAPASLVRVNSVHHVNAEQTNQPNKQICSTFKKGNS